MRETSLLLPEKIRPKNGLPAPMDKRLKGNLAAVASLDEPCGLGALSFAVSAARHIMHAEFVQYHTVGTAYSDASSHSLLRVDAVCAMRTGFLSFSLKHR